MQNIRKCRIRSMAQSCDIEWMCAPAFRELTSPCLVELVGCSCPAVSILGPSEIAWDTIRKIIQKLVTMSFKETARDVNANNFCVKMIGEDCTTSAPSLASLWWYSTLEYGCFRFSEIDKSLFCGYALFFNVRDYGAWLQRRGSPNLISEPGSMLQSLFYSALRQPSKLEVRRRITREKWGLLILSLKPFLVKEKVRLRGKSLQEKRQSDFSHWLLSRKCQRQLTATVCSPPSLAAPDPFHLSRIIKKKR